MEKTGLDKFTDNVIKEGITTIDKILGKFLTIEMDDYTINKTIKGEGHKIKLKNKIQEIIKRRDIPFELLVSGKFIGEGNDEIKALPITNHQYEEFGIIDIEKNIEKSIEKISKISNIKKIKKVEIKKVELTEKRILKVQQDQDLVELEKYEEEQRRLFQEAVMEFRKMNKSSFEEIKVVNQEVEDQNKFLYEITPESQQSNNFYFDSIFNKQSNNFDELYNNKSEDEKNYKSYDTLNNNLLPLNSIKLSCVNCFKLCVCVSNQETLVFCSNTCEDIYQKENIVIF